MLSTILGSAPMYRVRIAVTASLCLVPLMALGQDATSTISDGQINAAYDWVCSNRSTIEPIIETLAGLGVLSIPLHIAGALMKKASITKASPWLYKAWQVIRVHNADVKPPPAAIVQNAAEVVATTPGLQAVSGANPANMTAAAEVLKTAAKA